VRLKHRVRPDRRLVADINQIELMKTKHKINK
jgi:hypothetical protein